MTKSHVQPPDRLARNLTQGADQIWRARDARAHALSFPAHGHAACFAIEDASFWFAHRSACITAVLRRHGVVGPLLDVGGGNGAVSAALERAGIETVLLEPGLTGARNAHARGLRNVVCATLEDADFADRAFDAVGLFDVIEHVDDDAALLRAAHRVLRPGGTLCVTVPAHGWLWSAEDELAGHHRRYTCGSLGATLARCGFEVAYQSYLFAPLVAPVLALRTVPHRLAKRSTATLERRAAAYHAPSPLVRRALELALAPELAAIRAGRRVPFGTSCLTLATRATEATAGSSSGTAP